MICAVSSAGPGGNCLPVPCLRRLAFRASSSASTASRFLRSHKRGVAYKLEFHAAGVEGNVGSSPLLQAKRRYKVQCAGQSVRVAAKGLLALPHDDVQPHRLVRAVAMCPSGLTASPRF